MQKPTRPLKRHQEHLFRPKTLSRLLSPLFKELRNRKSSLSLVSVKKPMTRIVLILMSPSSHPPILHSRHQQPTVKYSNKWPRQQLTLEPTLLLKINQANSCNLQLRKTSRLWLLSRHFQQKSNIYSNLVNQVRSTRPYSTKSNVAMSMKSSA